MLDTYFRKCRFDYVELRHASVKPNPHRLGSSTPKSRSAADEFTPCLSIEVGVLAIRTNRTCDLDWETRRN
jgi:hypothetical protein